MWQAQVQVYPAFFSKTYFHIESSQNNTSYVWALEYVAFRTIRRTNKNPCQNGTGHFKPLSRTYMAIEMSRQKRLIHIRDLSYSMIECTLDDSGNMINGRKLDRRFLLGIDTRLGIR
jgi:hypothetical protein